MIDMHFQYILHTYLKHQEYCIDQEFDTKEEAYAVMDKAIEALTESNMKSGLLRITPELVINVEEFICMKITELSYYDSDVCGPRIGYDQTTLDDFMPATIEVKYNEQ